MRNLAAVGKRTELIRFADRTRILILPHGGRVLGLFPPGDDKNFFWTHPALESADGVRGLYAGDAWPNPGGDRTWLAPERELFIADMRRPFETYRAPATVDPGAYTAKQTGGQWRWKTRARVTLFRSRKTVGVELEKTMGPAPHPLRHEGDFSLSAAYAGYTLHTSLRILSGLGKGGFPVGIWNLLQMPHGGRMLIPTFGRAEPTVFFGKISRRDLAVHTGMVRYHMRAKGNHKISLRAPAIMGRVGYVYPSTGVNWNLVVRNFNVNPSGDYVDTPWDAPADRGHAFQACNVNSEIGCFSELEYHAPVAAQGTGGDTCREQSQVWAFRGRRQSIEAIARRLLGVKTCC